MNTLQNVYDRLSDKTELAKHEVNLGLVDNAKVLLKILLDDAREQDLIIKNYVAIEKTLRNNMLNIEQTSEKLKEQANKIIKLEKELGVKGEGENFLEFGKNVLINQKKKYPLK